MTAYPLFAPQWIGFVIAAAGVASFIWAAFFYRRGVARNKRYRWRPEWNFSFQKESWFPFRRLMRLSDATAFAYEKTLKNDMAFVAERMTERGASVSGYYATSMTHQGGVPLFGSKPPSIRLEHISLRELKTYYYSDDVSVLTSSGGGEAIYTNLMIKRVDLVKWIKTKGREKYFED